ncbi:mandelate racemase, partial [bacterium]|nr:mandelate racemase [bacterium]
TVGWGESVPVQAWSEETLEGATFAIRNYIAPIMIGMDPFDLNGIHLVINKAIAPGYTTGAPITKAGVDMALHDLICKAKGLTLAQYWGRASGGPITLSWTLNPVSLDDLDALIDEGWNLGYRNFNVKVAPDPAYDLELCRRVKERVPDGFLWADANGGYELSTALHIAPKLAAIGVDVLEQPLRPNQIGGYQRMRKQSALPIILDEGVIAPRDLLEWIRLDLLDGVAMKPARCGGLRSARRQVEILEDAGLLFLGSGLTDPDVSLSATLALYGAFGLRFPAALNGPQFLAHSVLKTPLTQSGGLMQIPAGPGLGVEVDEVKITEILSEPR